MAVLNAGSSDWPTSKDTYTDEVDDPKTAKTRLRAAIINGMYSWISNTQDDLGGSLKGSKSDAQTRIAVRHANDGTDLDKVRVLGANSLTTLQDAIDDLGSDGGEVFLPHGTETLTAVAELETKHRIRGSGSASIIAGTEGGHKVLYQDQSANVEGISIKDLTIDGDSDSGSAADRQQYHGIDLSNTTYTADDNIIGPTLWIKNVGGDGVDLRNANRNIVMGSIIDLNWQGIGANLCGRNGVASLDGDTLIIKGLIIRRGATAGIDLEPALATELINRVVISDCIIEDCLYGIAVNSTVGGLGDVEYVAIDNCVIKIGDASASNFNVATAGIKLAYAKNVRINNCIIQGQDTVANSGVGIYIQYSDKVEISNCTIYKGTNGIQIENADTAATEEIMIRGCRVSYCNNYGISLPNYSGGNGTSCVITDNVVYNNSQSGAGSYEGIYARYWDNIICRGNHCYDDGTPTQKSGITLDTATNVIMTENIASGNVTTQLRAITANITTFEYGHNIGAITTS